MYTLKVPSPSEFTALSKAFSEMLAENKIDMIDRRNATAYVLGKIVGDSLPVFDMTGGNMATKVWRENYLTNIKTWLGRVSEAVVIDHEMAIMCAYHVWQSRCEAAFPVCAQLHGEEAGCNFTGWVALPGGMAAIVSKYPAMRLGLSLGSLLTVRGGL